MYIETITDDLNIFKLERQKNTPEGKWYGICFSSDDKALVDNDTYIIGELYYGMRDDWKRESRDIGLEGITKNDAKTIVKIIKKADKLGWFDETRKAK